MSLSHRAQHAPSPAMMARRRAANGSFPFTAQSIENPSTHPAKRCTSLSETLGRYLVAAKPSLRALVCHLDGPAVSKSFSTQVANRRGKPVGGQHPPLPPLVWVNRTVRRRFWTSNGSRPAPDGRSSVGRRRQRGYRPISLATETPQVSVWPIASCTRVAMTASPPKRNAV